MLDRAFLRRVGVYLGPHRARWFTATALLAAETACGIAAALLAKPLFDGALARGGAVLAVLLVKQGALFTAGTLVGLLRARLYTGIGADAARALAQDLYRSVQRQDLSLYARVGVPEIQQRVYGDTQSLEGAFSHALGGAFVAMVKVAAVGGWMLWADRTLSAAVFASLAAAAGLAALSARASKPLLERHLAAATAYVGHILETLGPSGLLLRSTYGLGPAQERRFAALGAELNAAGLMRQTVPNVYSQAISLDVYLLGLAVFLLGGALVSRGAATLGTLMVFAAMAGYITAPAIQLSGAAGFFAEAGVRLRRIFELMDREPAARSPEGGGRTSPARGPLRARGLSFAYDAHSPLLEDVDIEVAPGRVTALLGPSGSGKTTLTYLLMRLLERAGGAAELDGTDLRAWDLDTLRLQFSYAGQEALLFPGTLRENLTLGAAASEAAVREALELSGFAAKARSLPEGLDARLGEGGLGLSGGERQKLALARALLKRSPVYILDEPTAFWDAESERTFPAVLDALRRRGAAVLLITHRPELAAAADKQVHLLGDAPRDKPKGPGAPGPEASGARLDAAPC